MPQPYAITEARVESRPVAGVRAHVRRGHVAGAFGQYLDQVYAAARTGAIMLDGQNIFIYRDASDGMLTVDFCVGVTAPFEAYGSVTPLSTPSGMVATTTHVGDYGKLGDANTAILEWCRANNHPLAGPSWEIYGHAHPDPAKCRTDVYYLLAEPTARLTSR